MCGRYAFFEHQELSARLISLVLDTSLFDHFHPTWNAAPSQSLPVIVEDDGASVIREMRWAWSRNGRNRG